jgi:Tol biopolymer transport system component
LTKGLRLICREMADPNRRDVPPPAVTHNIGTWTACHMPSTLKREVCRSGWGIMNVLSLTGLVLTGLLLAVPPVPVDAAPRIPSGDIVFTHADDPGSSFGRDISIIGADGRHRRQLTHFVGFDVSPAWSPDGSRIAFSSARSMPPGFQGDQRFYSEVYVMRADGSHVKRITFTPGVNELQPAWSPDGRRIVVSRAAGTAPPPGSLYPTPPSDLVIIDLATGRERKLTDTPNTWEQVPHWSPDEKRIAFDGDTLEPGNPDVYTIKVDGTGLQRLTTHPGFDEFARYAPDGKQLVFDSDRAGGFADVFLMRTDGTHVRQLTNDHASYLAGFSPDGRFIAFTRDINELGDVFRMRANGTQQVNLTRSPSVNEFDPDWQPSSAHRH